MSQSLVTTTWEAIADLYALCIDTNPRNAYYERPATLSLLPEIKGKHILDAGCGPGVYTEWLVNHGAEVVALDISPRMVEFASKRVGTRATILQADIGQPLIFLQDASFDIVLSALALDYVLDWNYVFREFFRVLRQPGYLVFSIGHPLADFILSGAKNYFHTELIQWEWRSLGVPIHVPAYRRPLSAVLNPLIEAGFALERILEPTPTEQFKEENPNEYEELSRRPGFLCIRAAKR